MFGGSGNTFEYSIRYSEKMFSYVCLCFATITES
jgi:hypothetical protein